MCEGVIVYIFGYGSLIWRPGFPYLRKFDGYIKGWKRYFWQASTDHRGTVEDPGRVVTLVKDQDNTVQSETWGTVYCVPGEEAEIILKNLDYREKGGYSREEVDVFIRGQDAPVAKKVILYIANEKNTQFTGASPTEQIAEKIYKCVGPSGPNIDYLLNLAYSMRRMHVIDDHIVELENLVLALVKANPLPHHTHPSLSQHSGSLEIQSFLLHRDSKASSNTLLGTTTTTVNISSDMTTTVNISNNVTTTIHSSSINVLAEQTMMQRKYFLSPNAAVKGIICIDDGAVMAVSQRGRSLLAAGIVYIRGDFAAQDLISVINQNGVEISRGISIYGSDEIVKITGQHSSAISQILGFTRGEAVVHHNNMILV